MSDKMREEFEVWASQYDYDLSWSELIDCYSFSVTRILFDTWQASRQALVVDIESLPSASYTDDGVVYRSHVEVALEKAGIKCK